MLQSEDEEYQETCKHWNSSSQDIEYSLGFLSPESSQLIYEGDPGGCSYDTERTQPNSALLGSPSEYSVLKFTPLPEVMSDVGLSRPEVEFIPPSWFLQIGGDLGSLAWHSTQVNLQDDDDVLFAGETENYESISDWAELDGESLDLVDDDDYRAIL
ncbi:hypothetical protein BDW22DRAFT_1353293 [Trametopsis cervina]|nr:hypothetical protein BDW22DRAFT_1353293 [Trametopsis cervina]